MKLMRPHQHRNSDENHKGGVVHQDLDGFACPPPERPHRAQSTMKAHLKPHNGPPRTNATPPWMRGRTTPKVPEHQTQTSCFPFEPMGPPHNVRPLLRRRRALDRRASSSQSRACASGGIPRSRTPPESIATLCKSCCAPRSVLARSRRFPPRILEWSSGLITLGIANGGSMIAL